MQVWEAFWAGRAKDKGFANTALARARLALIESSKDVRIEGVTFKDSQFWNCHLYKNDGVLVRKVRFHVPDDYKQAPSTDGMDIDSSRDVTVDGCFFSITDDCIACKGSKGPRAMEDRDSPPVERIRVRNCEFHRGGGVLTCGSEATVIRDVIAEDCRITGAVRIATLKLRPDTPQHYEDITFRNIVSEGPSSGIINMSPWTQYFDLQGMEPPKSIVKNLKFIGIKGDVQRLRNHETEPRPNGDQRRPDEGLRRDDQERYAEYFRRDQPQIRKRHGQRQALHPCFGLMTGADRAEQN